MSEHIIRRIPNQKTISQQIVDDKKDIWNNGERLGLHDQLVSEWSRGCRALARELAVIDVGNGKDVEVHRSGDGDNRKHDGGKGYDPPPDTLPSAIGGVIKRGHTLKEQYDDHS